MGNCSWDFFCELILVVVLVVVFYFGRFLI